MITKTIGVGGDFADLGLAWNWVWETLCSSNIFIQIPDNLKFNIISDFIENTGMHLPTDSVNVGGRSVSIVNTGNYLSTFANNTICHRVKTTTGSTADVFNIEGLIIKAPSASAATVPGILSFCAGNAGNRITTNYKNVILIGAGITGTGCGILLCDDWRWSDATLLNCKIYNFGTGIGFSDLRPDIILNKIENTTIYGCKYGITLLEANTAARVTTMKNVVCSGSTTKDFNILTNTNDVITNCADSDNSIVSSGAILSGNKTGITDADFLSVDPTSPNFLRIPTTGNLYGAGITTGLLPENTASIEGYPRPNVFGAVSIGAHEPNVAIDFAGNPRDPAIMDPVSFVPIINEATIPSYVWTLDDGKVSFDANPIDAYTKPGLKDITLVAQDSVGRFATVTKLNYIDVHPYKLGFTAVPMSGECPLKVKFTSNFSKDI